MVHLANNSNSGRPWRPHRLNRRCRGRRGVTARTDPTTVSPCSSSRPDGNGIAPRCTSFGSRRRTSSKRAFNRPTHAPATSNTRRGGGDVKTSKRAHRSASPSVSELRYIAARRGPPIGNPAPPANAWVAVDRRGQDSRRSDGVSSALGRRCRPPSYFTGLRRARFQTLVRNERGIQRISSRCLAGRSCSGRPRRPSRYRTARSGRSSSWRWPLPATVRDQVREFKATGLSTTPTRNGVGAGRFRYGSLYAASRRVSRAWPASVRWRREPVVH